MPLNKETDQSSYNFIAILFLLCFNVLDFSD